MLSSLAQHVKHTEHALIIAYSHPLRAVLLHNFHFQIQFQEMFLKFSWRHVPDPTLKSKLATPFDLFLDQCMCSAIHGTAYMEQADYLAGMFISGMIQHCQFMTWDSLMCMSRPPFLLTQYKREKCSDHAQNWFATFWRGSLLAIYPSFCFIIYVFIIVLYVCFLYCVYCVFCCTMYVCIYSTVAFGKNQS